MFASPIMAVLNKAMLAQSTGKTPSAKCLPAEFTLLTPPEAMMTGLDGDGRK
jgi:hypothetical protein